LFPHYSLKHNPDGSYNFISEQGHNYLIYFSESTLPDSENNTHIVYNLGFSRNGDHSCEPFTHVYNGKIRATITLIIDNFFKKNDHRTLIYFCFGDDGYSRHRNIVFNQWFKDLNDKIEKCNRIIAFEDNKVYACLVIVKDNPLKGLILDAFDEYLNDLKDSKN